MPAPDLFAWIKGETGVFVFAVCCAAFIGALWRKLVVMGYQLREAEERFAKEKAELTERLRKAEERSDTWMRTAFENLKLAMKGVALNEQAHGLIEKAMTLPPPPSHHP